MELNKPLSVHMTHEEYAKYLAFKEDERWEIKYNEVYKAMCHNTDVYSKELNAKDEAIIELLETIKRQENTIALWNSYDYPWARKSWWRSLWN